VGEIAHKSVVESDHISREAGDMQSTTLVVNAESGLGMCRSAGFHVEAVN
jgi:hypothetical protein